MRTDFNPHSPFRQDGDPVIPFKLPPDIPVVCILTHLPSEKEYHEHRWEIVTNSLKLARQNAGVDHHLLIWDNGSCKRLRKWLIDFDPDTLILSDNIGVVNAMRRVFGMFHDCTVVWCNDDLIYYPNWLKPQLDIFYHYPNVATVSGCVTRFYSGKQDSATLEWAQRYASLGFMDTPIEWDIKHGESIGKRDMVNGYRGTKIPMVKYDGVPALIGGNHCQMVCNPRLLYPLLGETQMYMHPLFQTLDTGINGKGYLRLLTTERLTRHIGNVMTDDDRKEVDELVD